MMIIRRSKSKASCVLQRLHRSDSHREKAVNPVVLSKPTLPPRSSAVPSIVVETADIPESTDWVATDSHSAEIESTAPSTALHTATVVDPEAISPRTTFNPLVPGGATTAHQHTQTNGRDHTSDPEDESDYEPVQTRIRTWGNCEAVLRQSGDGHVDEDEGS